MRSSIATMVVCILALGVQSASFASAQGTGSKDWGSFVDRFLESYFVANPSFAVVAGRHDFDGQLPDWSASGIQNEVRRLEQWRTEVRGFTYDALSPQQRFQRDYLVSRIDADLFWLRDAGQPYRNPAFYVERGLDPNTYVALPYAPLDVRLRAFVRYAKAIPEAVAQIRGNLHRPLPRTFVDYGIAAFDGLAVFYRNDAIAAFAGVEDEPLQRELKVVSEAAASAMGELGATLRSLPGTEDNAYALGVDRFTQMLRMTENVASGIERLEAVGRADLERNLSALAEACKAYIPDATISDCVTRLGADKPTGGPVEGARNQLAQLKQYVAERDIVSIPGTEEALVKEAPAYKRQNFAYIDIPGPYENHLPSIYYIAPPDPAWPQAERDAYVPGKADLLFTSVHEVWPGHFLQFLHSHRSHWRFGQVFVGYAFAEGWAHYGEELMVEEGLVGSSPELRVGQIYNALLRNVRLVCAIGLHTQGMTVEQCERLFKDKAYQDPGNARQQAARGTYDPAYLNYTLGKLMIRKLRSDWEAENPGRPRKEFHDQFLSFGGPPIPLVRSQMLKHDSGELF